MAKQKKCEELSCLFDKGHEGPHALICKPCEGGGIVLLRDNWIRCLVCKGRGWQDVKRKKKRKENVQRA